MSPGNPLALGRLADFVRVRVQHARVEAQRGRLTRRRAGVQDAQPENRPRAELVDWRRVERVRGGDSRQVTGLSELDHDLAG